MKSSAFFRVSSQAYPYEDARRQVRQLVDAFGVERVMYGTDWPWVSEKEGYERAWRILERGQEGEEGERAADNGAQVLTEEEKEWVYGKTALSLFENPG